MWRRASRRRAPLPAGAIAATTCSARQARRVLAGCRRRSMETTYLGGLETLWRPPTIEPIVPRAQFFSAHPSHRQIAHEGLGPGQPIDARLATGGLLGAHGPVPPRALISAQRVGWIVKILGEHVSKHGSVLDRHRGA